MREIINRSVDTFSLTKAIYVTAACSLSYLYLNNYIMHLFVGATGAPQANHLQVHLDLPILFLSYIVIFFIGILAFRPTTSLLSWGIESDKPRTLLDLSILGIATGLVASIIASPLPLSSMSNGVVATATQIAEILHCGDSIVFTIVVTFIIVLLVAASTELMFRGIVFRSLEERASLPSAVIASCLLCSIVWPVYNVAAGILFGALSALLFYRTRRILSSIIANISFSLTSHSLSVLFHKVL